MDLMTILRLNLQYFSQDDTGGSNPNPDEITKENEETSDEKENEEPKFTQEQVDKIIKDRLARAEAEREKAVKEAEKLAKMNAEQKREYELQKAKDENEKLKAELNRYELGKTATAILAESGIPADDEILSFVVREDAEKTNEAVQAFVSLVDRISDERMKEKLRGKSPRKQTGQPSTMSREEIMKIQDTAERQRLIAENIHLFR